jgi:acyl-CoA reductase-like NAD-dependent aldehyde dehydrogenase
MSTAAGSTPLVSEAEAGNPHAYRMFIGGDWVEARSGKVYETVDPFTGRAWATVPDGDSDDVDAAVRAARHAFDDGPWGLMTGTERARLLRCLADLIPASAERIAVIETVDNGKLIREMRGQLEALAEYYLYFAGVADKIHGETIPNDKPNYFVYTRREPVGVVGAITAWNSPLLLLTWKLAPALAAGCTFVVKPAEQTPASTLEFARLFEEAGFPDGVFNVVTGFGPTAGAPLAAHPGVDKVAFTGATSTGTLVMKGAAEHVARVSLELGGKSPHVIFDDADLEAATNGIVAGIFAAAGQTCIAGSRLFVQRGVHDEIVDRVVKRAQSIKLGNPLHDTTEMGPIAFQEQLDKIKEYIAIAQEEGAVLASGGKEATDPELSSGFFIEPTVFTGVHNEMRIAREEVFGPVLSVIPFETEEELIAQANDTPYGLGAGIWTRDLQRAHRVAHAIRAGSIWINCYRVVAPSAPFGGYKLSGVGRENGLGSLEEYTEVKTVWLELSGETRDPLKLP